MISRIVRLGAVALFVVATSGIAGVAAKPSHLYYNLQDIVEKSEKFQKESKRQMEKGAALEKKQNRLIQLDQELRSAKVMDESVKKSKSDELEKLARELRDESTEFSKEAEKASMRLIEEIKAEAAKIAKARGAQIVEPVNPLTVIVDQSLLITDDLIKVFGSAAPAAPAAKAAAAAKGA